MFHGAIPFSAIKYAMRCAIARVLPEPAPARISRGPSVCSTATRCCSLREDRKSAITMESLFDISFNHMNRQEQNQATDKTKSTDYADYADFADSLAQPHH